MTVMKRHLLKHSSPVFIAVLSSVAFGQIPIDKSFAEYKLCRGNIGWPGVAARAFDMTVPLRCLTHTH
jgi:hypothetical protein